MKEKIAIIGSGIAGLGSAYFLKKHHDITIFEKNSYIGGHTNTIDVDDDGTTIPIDTGFIVYNEVTYPNLTRLFQEIGLETKNSKMSFSVQHTPSGLEFCGSGLDGLFTQRKNLLSIRFWKLLYQINRFNTLAPKILDDPQYDGISIGQYIQKEKFGNDILDFYLVPMSSAVWSTPRELMLEFPATTLIRFFYNHGFLGLSTQHQWKTVANGSRSYIDKLIGSIKKNVLVNAGVEKVKRIQDGVEVILQNKQKFLFDKVIFATHADTTYQLLDSSKPKEKALLSQFSYNHNIATVHTDASIMPKNKKAWSSWNYRVEKTGGQNGWDSNIIYWMNSLQDVSKKKDYFISINDPGLLQKDAIIQTIEYEHPFFSMAAINAQRELSSLNKDTNIYYCGGYFRYGFHEDAFKSAVDLCTTLLGKDPWV